jgi:hypothetical protein
MCKSTYILAFTGTVGRNPSQGICIHKTKRGNGWEDAQSNLECCKKCHNWSQFTSELWMFGNWTVENLVHWDLVPGFRTFLLCTILSPEKKDNPKYGELGPGNAAISCQCSLEKTMHKAVVHSICSILGCYTWPHGNACFHRLCNNPGNRHLKTNASLSYEI